MTATVERRELNGKLGWWHYSFRQRRLVHVVLLGAVIETLWFAFAGFELNHTLPVFVGGFAGSAPLAKCAANAATCAIPFKAPPPFINPITELVIYVLPAICAVALVAPSLAKEFESKSIRFTWTQALTRNQWFLSRAVASFGAALVITGIAQIELYRWIFPHYFQSWPAWGMFAFSGTLAVGISLVLVAVAIFVALTLKRPVAAAIAVAVVSGAVLISASILYPFAISPKTVISSPGFPPFGYTAAAQGSNLIGTAFVTKSGSKVSPAQVALISGQCVKDTIALGTQNIGPQSQSIVSQCMESHNLYFEYSYQPSYRYWELQWVLTAVALAFTVLVTLGALYLTRRIQV